MDIKRPPRLLTYICNTAVIRISPAGFKFISWLLTTDHCHIQSESLDWNRCVFNGIFFFLATIVYIGSWRHWYFCNITTFINCIIWNKSSSMCILHHSTLTNIYIYRILAALKVETDIIAIITVRLIGRAVIPLKMYVKTFNTDVIVFICIKHHHVMLHWPIFSVSESVHWYWQISLNDIKIKNV